MMGVNMSRMGVVSRKQPKKKQGDIEDIENELHHIFVLSEIQGGMSQQHAALCLRYLAP